MKENEVSSVVTTHQNNILSVLANSRVKHTCMENPSEFSVFLISLYCGIYGATPPKIIMDEALHFINFDRLTSCSSSIM